ncbi:helix-turn-helix transcriptional regulator [Leucobacter iarius]|uniref:HTH cro/C1-type domain-containing protein n=1 Tax=Leucobacter iarius TaxID=333963 RepID=A0ABP4XHD1_9MICO
MVKRTSPARRRQLERLGEHVRAWRQLQGLSAAELARRAHVTRDTLRALEEGTGSPRLDSVMAVVSALGFAEHFVNGADPLDTESGRALAIARAARS